MPIISFGVIEKKLYIIGIMIIIRLIRIILWNEISTSYLNGTLFILDEEIGPIFASAIIYFFFKNKQKKKIKKAF